MRQLILIHTKVAIRTKGITYFLMSLLDRTKSNRANWTGECLIWILGKIFLMLGGAAWSLLTVRRDGVASAEFKLLGPMSGSRI